MTTRPTPFVAEDEYLRREATADTKHEYYAGTVYAMAGASEAHNTIALNLAALLHRQLRGSSCRAYPSDMRLRVEATGLYTYPDFMVVCGGSQFSVEARRDTVVNPTVLVEILSPSTETYDRGTKFQHYRQIPTLREYMLVGQHRACVERFVRQPNDDWLFSEAIGTDSVLNLASVAVELRLAEVYEAVDFPPVPPLRIIKESAGV
jgi:Uma2 family endonuclease